jgi:hypothetical protein
MIVIQHMYNMWHTFFVLSALALSTRFRLGLIGSTHSLLSSVHGMFAGMAHGGGAAFDGNDSDLSEESLNHEPGASVDEDGDEEEEGGDKKSGDKEGDEAQRSGQSNNKRSSDGGGGGGGWQDGTGPFIEDVD